MNEQAIRTEETLTNLIARAETILYDGWVLKVIAEYMIVYPLYSKSSDNMQERIQMCEQLGKENGATCIFRIPQYTNYFLKSRLLDNGYRATIGALNLKDTCLDMLNGESDVSKKVILEKNDYGVTDAVHIPQKLICGECISISENTNIKQVGIKQGDHLLINNGLALKQSDLFSILQFAKGQAISRVLVCIPDHEDLPNIYEQLGFEKAYIYTCYHKEDIKHGYTK